MIDSLFGATIFNQEVVPGDLAVIGVVDRSRGIAFDRQRSRAGNVGQAIAQKHACSRIIVGVDRGVRFSCF